MLLDAKIIIRPAHAFVIEQLKTNVHVNRLDTAVATEDAGVMLEPRKEDYPSLGAYHEARAAYLQGRKFGAPPT